MSFLLLATKIRTVHGSAELILTRSEASPIFSVVCYLFHDFRRRLHGFWALGELEVLGCLLLYQLNGGFVWMRAPFGIPHRFSVMILNDISRDGQTTIPGRGGEKY